MTALRRRSWPPYVAGALIGVLSWFSFATADKPLGISGAFETTAAIAQKTAAPAAAASNPFFAEPDKEVKIGWEWMLVIGVFLGAFASAAISGDRSNVAVPETWRRRFGGSRPKRYTAAFAGGAVMMLGARIAGGCTSGHGISGMLQLAVASWMWLPAAFGSAILVGLALYGRRGGAHV